MPMPLWFGHVNKHLFNRLELNRGNRPVLHHVGRSSGATYRTPLDAHAVDGGYIFILVYGSKSDWVQNILASGEATLEIDGAEIPLATPQVIGTAAAWDQLPSGTKPPPKNLNIGEYLKMNLAA